MILLSLYTSTDEHFLFYSARETRKATFDVDGTQEELWYRIVACAGAKVCTSGCSFVALTQELKCPLHPNQPLCNVGGNCSVEFVYVWLDDSDEKHRWLSGLSLDWSDTQQLEGP